jgi:hypothetical protein
MQGLVFKFVYRHKYKLLLCVALLSGAYHWLSSIDIIPVANTNRMGAFSDPVRHAPRARASTVTAVSSVKKKNIVDNNKEHLKAFIDDGWRQVNTQAPDEDLINLNFDAFRGRESELSHYILSNSFDGAELEKLSDIFLKAEEDKTKYAAVDALGRSQSAQAQSELMKLYDGHSNTSDKDQILPLLRPQHEGDATYQLLLSVAHDKNEPAGRRDQAIFTLIVFHLKSEPAKQIPERLISRFENSVKPRVQELFSMTRGGGPSHSH